MKKQNEKTQKELWKEFSERKKHAESMLAVVDTDGYKPAHAPIYPSLATWAQSYYVSRGGGLFDQTVWFGLQAFIKEHLMRPITRNMIDSACQFLEGYGAPFNYKRMLGLADLGYWPLKIRSLPEGTVVPKKTPLMTFESTHKDFIWVPNYLETQMTRLWGMSNVATLSYHTRLLFEKNLELTSDLAGVEIAPGLKLVDIMLHCFGSRGVNCQQAATMLGMAHLTSFKGTDTIPGLIGAWLYYYERMAGATVPATEHSTMTFFGRAGEFDQIRKTLELYQGGIVSIVSDSYDLWETVKFYCSDEIQEFLVRTGTKLVVRPDSGVPWETSVQVLELIEQCLANSKYPKVTINSKGYKVLPSHMGLIYGDGINWVEAEPSLPKVHQALIDAGWSVENIVLGMGGGLLTKHDRDTHKMAFKMCSAMIDGKIQEIYKDPITDPGKSSLAGILDVVQNSAGSFQTIKRTNIEQLGSFDSMLRTVYCDGKLLIDEDFETIRNRLWPK